MKDYEVHITMRPGATRRYTHELSMESVPESRMRRLYSVVGFGITTLMMPVFHSIEYIPALSSQ
jgi:hypothetical protein